MCVFFTRRCYNGSGDISQRDYKKALSLKFSLWLVNTICGCLKKQKN